MENRNGIFCRRPFSPGLVFAAVMVGFVAVIVLTVSLYATRPVHADHNSMQVVCPDPILEGNSGQMKIKRSGYRIVHAVIFTHEGAYTASPNDFEEYHGVKFESKSDEKTLKIPIITKEDSTPEHDEQFAIGFMSGSTWHQCMVTIEDDDAPEILDVNIISSPVDGDAYRAGESIDVGVDFDFKVEVEGTPLLSLFLGEGPGNTWRGAEYRSGSGTRFLVFRYRVEAADMDTDGVSVGSAYSGADGRPAQGFSGNIFAEGTDVPIDYAHSGVNGDGQQKVDGRPYVQGIQVISSPPDGWYEYRANQTIEFSFSYNTNVVVEGDVGVGFFLSGIFGTTERGTLKHASYLRGSGTDTLVFGYTVLPGDMDDTGIILAPVSQTTGFGGSGTVKAKGTDVDQNTYYHGGMRFTEHKVDTSPPAISSVEVTSRPTSGDAYNAGDVISVEVLFNENVTLRGEVVFDLEIGGAVAQAILRPTSLTYMRSLVFDYTVQEADTDTDGVSIGANSAKPDGGGIYDSAGNSADLSHPVIASNPDHKVAASIQS